MLLKVNYFAAEKGIRLICRVFIKALMILLCLHMKFHINYFKMTFDTVLHAIILTKRLLV